MDGSSPLLLMSANALWGHPSKLHFEGTKTHLGILSGIVSLLWHSKQASSTTQWRCRILYLWRDDIGPQHTPLNGEETSALALVFISEIHAVRRLRPLGSNELGNTKTPISLGKE